MLETFLSLGDVVVISADGLITTVDATGHGSDVVEVRIKQRHGNVFHDQAVNAIPLKDGDVIYAPEPVLHSSWFRSAIFVVDELQRPLRQLVLSGLREADQRQLRSVSLPLMRLAALPGKPEQSENAIMDETIAAIEEFKTENPQRVRRLDVVVNNTDHYWYLRSKGLR